MTNLFTSCHSADYLPHKTRLNKQHLPRFVGAVCQNKPPSECPAADQVIVAWRPGQPEPQRQGAVQARQAAG